MQIAYPCLRKPWLAVILALLLVLPSPVYAMKPHVSRVARSGAAATAPTASPPHGVTLLPIATAPSLVAPGGVRGGARDPRAAQIAGWIRHQASAARASSNQAQSAQANLSRLSDEQRAAFEALRRRAGDDTSLSVRRRTGLPRQIRGGTLQRALAGAPGETPSETTARTFLRRNRALLRLDDPDREMTLRRETRDSLGRSHLRFRQSYRGIEVWPAELVVHLDSRGEVDVVGGAYAATPAGMGTTPTVTVTAAIVRARAAVPSGEGARIGTPRLLIYMPPDAPARLAWKLKVEVSLMSQWVVVVDASDASVLAAFNDVQTMNVPSSGTDLQSNLQNFGAWFEGGTHFMVDTTKSMFDPTSNPPNPSTTRGAIIIQDAQNQPPTSNVQSLPPLANVTSITANGPWLADAVSATANFSAVYDYFLNVHGRNSLDDAGASILAGVRIGLNFQNAFFISENNFMGFGDGEPFAGALDVVAHELAHGVTFHTAGLIYQDQSGALNEAFSDIFGESVEGSVLGAPDWLIGTNLSSAFRNMQDPSSLIIGGLGVPYPEKLSEFINTSQDNGGVHLNSSIINHAYYQLVEGLPQSISRADGEAIFYRALTVHLTASSQFIDARLACIQAAEELFNVGSAQALRTAEAFDFVEIFEASGTPDPPTFPGADGEDATLFLFTDPGGLCTFTSTGFCLGRRETPADGALGSGVSLFDVEPARPAVVRDGSLAVFVNASADMCLILTDGSEAEICLGLPDTVFSVAVSADGNKFGFVLLDDFGDPDHFIDVLDVTKASPDDVTSYGLVAPAPDGGELATVLFADAMDFTVDERFLIYDALNDIPQELGGTVTAWSIYAIDLVTGATLTLVAPVGGLDIGFPALSQTSDNFVVFDVLDQQSGAGTVYAGDLNTGDLAVVGQLQGFGVPGYNGDDTAVVFSKDDATTLTGFSLYEQPVAEDRITPTGPASLFLSDADYGVIYRRAVPEPSLILLHLTALGMLGLLVRIRRRSRRR